MLDNENNSMPYIKSLTTCLNRMIADGYAEDFKVTENGLEALQAGKKYRADEVSVINSFRFEGASDPENNAILYILQTKDGLKGTLIDAYGLYNNHHISRFIKQAVAIEKKITES